MEEIIKDTDIIEENPKKILPLIALRGKVLFPNTMLNFDVGRTVSLNAVDKAVKEKTDLFITSQKSAFVDVPKPSDINRVGVIARIKQVIKTQSTGNMKVFVEAVSRAKIVKFVAEKNLFAVEVIESPYIGGEDEFEVEAYLRLAKKAFLEYSLFDKRLGKDMVSTVAEMKDANEFVDNALSVVNFKESEVQSVLETDDTVERLIATEKLFAKEVEIQKIEKKITGKVRQSIDKSQKEFYLREQLKAIHTELGDDPEEGEELAEKIREKVSKKNICIFKKIKKNFKKNGTKVFTTSQKTGALIKLI